MSTAPEHAEQDFDVDAPAAQRLIAGGYRAVDVREDWEYDAGHIDGSLHIPMSQLPARLNELSGQAAVVVCRTGSRSGHVTAFLSARGMTARNLAGGLQHWMRSGMPLIDVNGDAGSVV